MVWYQQIKMIIHLGFVVTVLYTVSAQNSTTTEPAQAKETTTAAPAAISRENEIVEAQPEVNQFYLRPQLNPQLVPYAYLEPQLQFDPGFSRIQPQVVLYGGGQGQPILINPGNPPGNFLIPQGPGPNIIVRNNPQGSVFPVAGYPKPAHIPPIEKDAEEIPVNPAKIPPFPKTKPASKGKPEKLETFNEPNSTEQSLNNNVGQFPAAKPDSTSLQPGERFFILNGDNIFAYPIQAESLGFPGLKYTSVEPFPKNPPKFVLQKSNLSPISLPNLILQNSVENSQSPPSEESKVEENRKILRNAQSYARTLFPENVINSDYRLLNQDTNQNSEFVPPQLVGQFRFVPNAIPNFYPYRDDIQDDAVVIDANVDASNIDGRLENTQKVEVETTTTSQPTTTEKQSDPGTAQAGPQATAIAGPGGTAGSSPRGTAIVGKGGLAISSPVATAVAGTKEDEKKKNATTKKP